MRVSGNSGRLSVAGMACMKPGRPGRFFYRLRVHRRRKGDRPSMSEADYAHLITAAHHALNAPLIVIWDNLNTHRSRKMRAFTEAREDWLTVVRLPAYAPDLNAVEGAWSAMKSGLGNHAAATLDQLEAMVRTRLRTHPAPARPHQRAPRPDGTDPRPATTVDPGFQLCREVPSGLNTESEGTTLAPPQIAARAELSVVVCRDDDHRADRVLSDQ